MKQIFLLLILLSSLNVSIIAQKYNTLEQYETYYLTNSKTINNIEGIWKTYATVTTTFADVSPSVKQTESIYAIIKESHSYGRYELKDGVYSPSLATTTFFQNSSHNYYCNYINSSTMLLSITSNYFNIIDNKFSYTIDNINGVSYGYSYTTSIKYTYIKIYPLEADTLTITPDSKQIAGSGTGFAISSLGYIATCNHVVDGATSIKVKGIGGDFSKSYTAKVISTDANNDLAIIKIDASLGTIPYTISTSTSDVGSSIFTLGYPLTATMGDEIKLTDGLISAKSGFKGDITSYQISAAAQPGNSGGPIFDKNGIVIGVLNAKYVAAENATYAVKSTYLNILIDALPTAITLPTLNSLTAKALTDQVKLVKNFIYIIEVN
jgi:S1-C subfamily serine protease